MQITRSYTAEDPVYFVGQYTGSDTIGVADLPYAPDKCTELTFVDYSREGQAAPATSRRATGRTPPAKPWWKFWD